MREAGMPQFMALTENLLFDYIVWLALFSFLLAETLFTLKYLDANDVSYNEVHVEQQEEYDNKYESVAEDFSVLLALIIIISLEAWEIVHKMEEHIGHELDKPLVD